jgi:hypothetical protein
VWLSVLYNLNYFFFVSQLFEWIAPLDGMRALRHLLVLLRVLSVCYASSLYQSRRSFFFCWVVACGERAAVVRLGALRWWFLPVLGARGEGGRDAALHALTCQCVATQIFLQAARPRELSLPLRWDGSGVGEICFRKHGCRKLFLTWNRIPRSQFFCGWKC